MEGNLPNRPPRHAPPQCSQTHDPDLQGPFSIYHHRSIQHIPQLLIGQTPPANRDHYKPPPPIQYCPCHLCLGSIKRPLQLLGQYHRSSWQLNHHPHQTRHPQILGLTWSQRFHHRPRARALPLLPSFLCNNKIHHYLQHYRGTPQIPHPTRCYSQG